MKTLVELYCDGACLGNPGPGGWAALLITKTKAKTHEKLISGPVTHTTNNQMELRAAIEGLKFLKRPCKVKLYSDSQYVVRGMREWMFNWKQRGYTNASNKPIANQPLWIELDQESSRHDVEWHWVKGHSGHPENERVDEAARKEAESIAHS